MPPRNLSTAELSSIARITPPLFKPSEEIPSSASSNISRTNGIGMRFSVAAFPEFVAVVSRIQYVGDKKTVLTNLGAHAPTFAPAADGGFWLFVSTVKGHHLSKWCNVARYFECDEFFVKQTCSGHITWFEFVVRTSFLSGITLHLLTMNTDVLKVPSAPPRLPPSPL